MAKKDYTEFCTQVLELVGGKDNIASVTHCITRLRFKLKDDSIAQTEKIEALKDCIKVMNTNGQYHVVVGNNKIDDVYEDFLKISGLAGGGEVAADDDEGAENKTIGAIVIDLISGMFGPILATFSGAGIMKGLLALFSFLSTEFGDGSFSSSGAYTLLYTVADGFFYFLPVALAVTAARKFKMSEFNALAIAMALVYPTMVALTEGEVLGSIDIPVLGTFSWYADFFGIPIIMPASGYTSSVIPIVLMVAFAAQVEKWVKSWIPQFLKMFITPLIVVTVAVVLGYLVIGPIATVITNLLGALFEFLFGLPVVGNLVGCVIVSALWMCLVIFGFHWSLVPLAILNLSTLGYDYVLGCVIGHSFSLGAVLFAMFLKNKDEDFRAMCIPAMISSFFFGVTEPAIYGAALPDKKAFVVACIGSAAGGIVCALTGCVVYMSGGLGVFNWLSFIDPSGEMGITYMVWAIVASMVSAVVGFVLEFMTYNSNKAIEA